MTSCRRTPLNAPFLALPGDTSNGTRTDAVRLLNDKAAEAARPLALRSLLLLSGAVQPHDAALARTTDADLAMLRETIELLQHIEAASAA